MPSRDPHSVLGVPRSATPQDIARAFRAAARRTHPDAPGGDAEAFAAATEAYAALRSRQPRRGVPIPVRRGGGDVAAVLRVRWPDAVLGRRLVVQTENGPVAVELPPGTTPGSVLHVPGPGRGALVLTVEVDVPTVLDEAERAAVEQLAAVLRPPSAGG